MTGRHKPHHPRFKHRPESQDYSRWKIGTPFALYWDVALRPFPILPFLTVSLLTWRIAVATQNKTVADFEYLRSLDVPHSYCEAHLGLELATEHFIEIANEVPGKEEYNDLIRIFRSRNWDSFDAHRDRLLQAHPTSPLREPIALLSVQTMFDRLSGDDPRQREAEKKLREVTLLYPKSPLLPVVTAGAAYHLIKVGAYQRALALYQKLLVDYGPKSPLHCLFQIGVGEAHFLLQEWRKSEESFAKVEKSCLNSRLRIGAMIRVADSRWLQELPGAEKMYEDALDKYGPIVRKFYPPVMHNLGEIKYRSKDYKLAAFYFNEFLRYERKTSPCLVSAMKRIADTAFHRNERWETVAGLYFAVREKAPQSDLGRFSYIQGLLIGLPQFAKVEYERRLRVIDDEIDRIQDESLRSLAYLGKGLTLLDTGEKAAMDYLVRLHERAKFSLNEGYLASFVRDRLLKILQAEVEGMVLHNQSHQASDGEIFHPVESAYELWLRGSKYEMPAKKFYASMILHRFEDSMKAGQPDLAIDKLERWLGSTLWSPPTAEQKRRVGVALANALLGEDAYEDSPAMTYLSRDKTLKPFLEGDFKLVWVAVALETGNHEQLKTLIVGDRRPASVDKKIKKDLRDQFLLALGKSNAILKRPKEMEIAFREIKDEDLEEDILRSRLTLYRELKDNRSALVAAKGLVPYLEPEERTVNLKLVYGIVSSGKLWGEVAGVLERAKESGLEGAELAPYLYLAGRGYFEMSKCKLAIESYELGLKHAPGAGEAAEARYRMGKCLVKEKRPGAAKQVWEELSKANDKFWSPLAANELKLMK